MTDTDTAPDATPSWKLPPAPGQFGAKPPQVESGGGQRGVDDVEAEGRFGFRRIEPAGLGPHDPYTPTFQNPSLRERAAGDWGSPDWVLRGMTGYKGGTPEGMFVPTERDIPGILHNTVMAFGRYASPNVAMPMIAGGRYAAAYSEAFAKGQIARANLMHQQALASMEIANYRMKQELTDYGSALASWGPHDKDPGNAQRLFDEVHKIAISNNDQGMLNTLASRDMGAVVRRLQYLDSNHQDLQKATAMIRLEEEKLKLKEAETKAAEAEQLRKDWGLTPPSPSVTKPDAAKTDTNAPDQAPAPPDRTAQADTSSPQPDKSYDVPLASPPVTDAARAMQMGEKPTIPKDAAIQAAVSRQKQRLDEYMHNLIGDKSLSADDVMARARAANPAMGDMVRGLLDGKIEFTPSASGKMAIAAELAGRIDPDWTRNAQRKKDQRELDARRAEISPLRGDLLTQEKMRSNIRDTVVKNVRDMDYLLQLAKRLRERGLETQIPIIDAHIREGRRTLTGDPDVAAFDAQLRNVRTDVGRILSTGSSGTGAVYPVSVQKEMREFFDKGVTVPQLQATINVIKRDYSNKLGPITEQINELNGRIAQIAGTQPPAPVSDDDIARELSAEETKRVGGKTYYKRNGEWYDE